MYNNDPQL